MSSGKLAVKMAGTYWVNNRGMSAGIVFVLVEQRAAGNRSIVRERANRQGGNKGEDRWSSQTYMVVL